MCMPASARGQRLSGSAITPPYDAQVGSMHFRIFRKRGQGETRQCIKHQTLNGNMWVGQGQTHWKMCIHIYIYISIYIYMWALSVCMVCILYLYIYMDRSCYTCYVRDISFGRRLHNVFCMTRCSQYDCFMGLPDASSTPGKSP
jgi:hypothetical protein